MLNLLKDKIALITGGTAGIGREIALTYARQGATVLTIGTHQERGAKITEELNALSLNKKAKFYLADVSNTEQVHQTVEEILKDYEKVDILVNNAGITRDCLLMKMKAEDWDAVMDVNVKSCYNMCHALIRSMMKTRTGSIINMSSIVGLIGNVGQVNYAASKAAIIGFTKALAKEVASRNIRVNCICPGFIDTNMTKELNETHQKALLEKIPLGRFGETKDIAHAALFLASELATYITGQTVVVDGGMAIG